MSRRKLISGIINQFYSSHKKKSEVVEDILRIMSIHQWFHVIITNDKIHRIRCLSVWQNTQIETLFDIAEGKKNLLKRF